VQVNDLPLKEIDSGDVNGGGPVLLVAYINLLFKRAQEAVFLAVAISSSAPS
jgi:hypothetical protein